MYKIKGTLQLVANEKSVSFNLFPDVSYLSPNKDYALAYLSDNSSSIHLKIDSNVVCLDGMNDKGQEALLNELAIQNKHIELHINSAEKITGFTYPAN